MFYVIVALWAIGCVACWLLRRVQRKVLTATCVAVPLVGVVVSLILMNLHAKGIAIAALLVSVYFFVILLSTLLTYRNQRSL
ncbi:hypothetical protein BECAL_02111 [Bellilinea caldifistulae]|uniref:Uncharacterized protein n=1 Tax=Bellilinea caldifistulae TaxID=360411 RepID=A0A0N8GKW2_9CHLR|nr:hypothetical protein [Bellilinea caldifistulae]KPL70810.1 hypothetical protein AC812_16860 [Bellilinea caldifistulae]GAP10933.1 hypothetical protein BECAL_02111 [Bellilinea caldifistulae]